MGLANTNEKLIEKIVYYKSHGKVLDLGCGEGELDVLLSERGFEVTALDKNPLVLHKLADLASKKSVFVETVCRDMINFRSEKKFDVIICQGALHFLKKEDATQLIIYLKKISAIGALHIIESHFEEIDLKELYKDFNIIEYQKNFNESNQKKVVFISALKI